MLARRFVLAPLAEIAPDLRVGPDRRRVTESLSVLRTDEGVEKLALPGWPPLGR
jgi:7,8-dihydro-6-hydroxymethylpterin-pyrophosphokinase